MVEGLRQVAASLSVRPPRRLVFVRPEEGQDWQQQILDALVEASERWGGIGDLMVPLSDDLLDNELFWSLADAHDADAYEILGGVLSGNGMPPKLIALLQARLGALGFNELLSNPAGPTLGEAPLAPVAMIRNLPKRVLAVEDTLGANHRLLLAASVGLLSQRGRQALEARAVGIVRQRCTSSQDLASVVFDGDRHFATPWDLSRTRLEHISLGAPHTFVPPVLVRGNDAWDFALYYALLRMRGLVWWAPDDIWEDEILRQAILSDMTKANDRSLSETEIMLAMYGGAGWRRGEVLALSASEPDKAKAAIAVLEKAGMTARSNSPWGDVIPDAPLRYLEGGRGSTQPLILHGDRSGPLPIPVPPDLFQNSDHRPWVATVTVEEWTPLRNVYGHLTWGCEHGNPRGSREGMVFDCSETPLASRDFRMAPLDEQLRGILGRRGWSARRSDKGAYAHRAAELFGDFPGLVNSLSQRHLGSMFRAFMSAKNEPDAPGRWLSAERRRVLTFDDLSSLLSGDYPPTAQTEREIEELRSREVLQLGSVLKCHRCRQQCWYDIEAFGRTFLCTRCRLEQPADRDSWIAPEPQWYYRIDEGLLQFLLHNGDLPVAAAAHDFAFRYRWVEAAFELEVHPPAEGEDDERGRKAFEIDIAVSYDTELWIGEATSQPRLSQNKTSEKERLLRLREIAELTGAQHVILATSGRWSDRTRTQIRQCFTDPWPTLHVKERCHMVPRPTRIIGRND
jgi:hypothetical protein